MTLFPRCVHAYNFPSLRSQRPYTRFTSTFPGKEEERSKRTRQPTSQRFVKNERKRRRSCLLITATTQWTLYYIYICIFNAPRGTRLLARTDREQRRKIDVFTDHVTFKISRITHVNEASYSCILEEFLG